MYKFWGKSGEKRARKIFEKIHYPNYFKREVFSSFEKIKNDYNKSGNANFFAANKKKIKELDKKIKVIGFNQYHEIISNYE